MLYYSYNTYPNNIRGHSLCVYVCNKYERVKFYGKWPPLFVCVCVRSNMNGILFREPKVRVGSEAGWSDAHAVMYGRTKRTDGHMI